MKDPVVLGNWLATRVKFSKNTSERLGLVSRVDAVCWYLVQQRDFVATSKDIKLFAGAFKATSAEKNTCCSLLNTCYGGVSNDFSGEHRWGSNYGRVAPLFRPFKHNYSPTRGGLHRAARVQALLDGSLPSATR